MRLQRRDVQVWQGAVRKVQNREYQTPVPFIAKVIKVYSDRLTCDIETNEGSLITDIPVLTKAGLVEGEVYGTVDLPEPGDYVVVGYAGYSERHKVIMGTFVPYLAKDFLVEAVNSSSKTYTKNLLEKDNPRAYKKIFKGGTTIEVAEDGTMVVETPGGGTLIMESSGKVTVNENLEVLL